MARIKCRYRVPYCKRFGPKANMLIGDYSICDTPASCELDGYEKPVCEPYKENGVTILPIVDTCIYCEYIDGEFEKTVKSYEYIGGDLRIGRKRYYEDEIKYLEIDGRVLVGKKEDENENQFY